MYQGRLIKWYGTHGFVHLEEARRDVFVHKSAFLKGFVPEVDSIITFELGPPNRPDKVDQAKCVRTVKKAADVVRDFQKQRPALLKALSGNVEGESQGGQL